MVFFCDANGVIKNVIPERVFQGSAGVNKVVFVGAFPSSAQVLMAFQLPNGIWTVPQMLSRTAELEGVTTKDGKAYSGWVGLIGATPQIDDNGAIIKDEGGNTLYNLDFSVTENYGTCMVQFYVYAASHAIQVNIDGQFVLRNVTGGLLATANSSFEIERGVPAIIPDLSEDDNQVLLTQILNALSNTQGNVDELHNNAVVDISLTLKGKMLDIVGKNTFDEDAAGNEVELPFVKTDGDTMTGALEIDEGGVKTSYGAGGITNNGNPITLPQKSGVIALIQDVLDAVSDKTGITFEVVEELPQENAKTNAIYLVPSGGNAPNVYDEFVFINNAWEKIGTTAIDLSQYLQIADFNEYLIEYLTNNTETLTDEEKSKACEWVGAVGQAEVVANTYTANSIVRRTATGTIHVNTPQWGNEAANKSYVDGKIAELGVGFNHHVYINHEETLHIWATIKSSASNPLGSISDIASALVDAGHIDIGSALMCTGAIDEDVPVSAMYSEDGTNVMLCIISPATPGGIETVELTEVDNIVDTIN